MNKRIGLGIAAVVVILAAGYFILHPTTAPGKNPVASTTSETASSTKPGTNTGKLVITYALFDSESFLSTSTYPTITGIANASKVGIVINNSVGKGILGAWEIPVTNGHWSYQSSLVLPPGWYTVVLFIGNGKTAVQSARLTVNKP